MDDEVFKMVNIEGQVGFRRAGFFFWFFFFWKGNIYMYVFFFLFQATTGSRSTVQSVGKEIPDQGKKTKYSGMGEKRKK